MHSVVMSLSGSGVSYVWCVRRLRVESDADSCAGGPGPFANAVEAERVPGRVRTTAPRAGDARWAGEDA
ncbi:hypothetical protein GCM10010123_12640 [Pilimelia anulata]|uniref:Uncharacterized protein n=1 Tax=Pilimelia anulata TaxID=53371 RepID=A0A8J3B804_9ACTN|nr:hypothetical protein GCM10010123_12640 [Pilimelia anulata]